MKKYAKIEKNKFPIIAHEESSMIPNYKYQIIKYINTIIFRDNVDKIPLYYYENP